MGETQVKSTVRSNPAVNTPNSTSQWFIDPQVDGNKYQQHSGSNTVTPYITGSEYLPALKTALENATKSIYISIWGFDPMLNMAGTGQLQAPTKDTIGEILRTQAAKGVEVKLLLFFHGFASKTWIMHNAPGIYMMTPWSDGHWDPTETPLLELDIDDYRAQWFSRAASGLLGNMQFIKTGGDDLSEANLKETQQRRRAFSTHYPLTQIPATAHHQKMLLIDHNVFSTATGFVQGINLMPDYVDDYTQPYHTNTHQGSDPTQDLGVSVNGTALIDLYHNFKEAWDTRANTPTTPIALPPPNNHDLADCRAHNVQILRTWPKTDEFTIERFYKNAFNHTDHLYVEDQYFRSPEFIEWLLARARDLRTDGTNKPLYLFVVTNTNGATEGDLREDIMARLGRKDMVSFRSDKKWLEHVESGKATEKAIDQAQALNIKVSIAILKSATATASNKYQYKDIYVHSKLTTFNDTCYTLGSANWNIRSMRADTELNIAVQNIHQTRKLRQDLWSLHFGGRLPDSNDMEEQNEEWQYWLFENDKKVAFNQQPISRAFSYHESIRVPLSIG